jgi:hypothetical protein
MKYCSRRMDGVNECFYTFDASVYASRYDINY